MAQLSIQEMNELIKGALNRLRTITDEELSRSLENYRKIKKRLQERRLCLEDADQPEIVDKNGD